MNKDSDAKNERNVSIGDNAIGSIIITGDNAQIIQAAPFTPPALYQLPTPSADFVGRKKEIKGLLKALKKESVIISGLGGVGKTELAYKLAQHLKPGYPDAQFYFDFKGSSKEPLSASDAMRHVIRSYHPTAQLPEDESGLRAIYLSLLAGKKALLLMDNAVSPAQLDPLIPPTTCSLIVTSRNHFTSKGLHPVILNTLEPKDAKQLLLKIAPRIGDYAEKIAELCGYLPLALEMAASAFHISVSMTPDEYVQRFSDTIKRLKLLDEVNASLLLSYELLNAEMQKLWRYCAVFPNTFDAVAVASLWEMNVEDTKDKLDKLISHSLIEWNETTRRYRLHDLARLVVDTRLSMQERHFARGALATYYWKLLAQANELYLKGSEEMIGGLTLFDVERENIEAGQAWSVSLIGKDEAATRLSIYYYFAGVYVLVLRLHPKERISWLEAGLKAAHLLNLKEAEGAALGNLGLAYMDLGEARKAIELYEQNLEIVRQTNDRLGQGAALGNLGIAFANLGETRKAIEFHEQSLLITREVGDRRGEASTTNSLGIAYGDLGETIKAIELLEQSRLISREIGDRRGEGNALGNLGIAFAKLGETQKSLELHHQALIISREIGDRKAEGIDLGSLGVAYYMLGETHKAIEFHQQRLTITREIGDRQSEGYALWNSAFAYYEIGRLSEAISSAETALEIFEQIESPDTAIVRSALIEWKADHTQ